MAPRATFTTTARMRSGPRAQLYEVPCNVHAYSAAKSTLRSNGMPSWGPGYRPAPVKEEPPSKPARVPPPRPVSEGTIVCHVQPEKIKFLLAPPQQQLLDRYGLAGRAATTEKPKATFAPVRRPVRPEGSVASGSTRRGYG
jgi:hypothetical protein